MDLEKAKKEMRVKKKISLADLEVESFVTTNAMVYSHRGGASGCRPVCDVTEEPCQGGSYECSNDCTNDCSNECTNNSECCPTANCGGPGTQNSIDFCL